MSAIASVILALAPALAGDHPVELDEHRRPALQTAGACLIRGATIHSAVGPAVVGDVLVIDGDIVAVGSVAPELVPAELIVIEAEG
ncbi:MAG: hypothetical protein QF411_09620, partial [Planctomycetota bacterium]|nr:hypothetical protein [Planctomycetota bacterium]